MQVSLDPVQYARSGAFSVNLWFRPGNLTGALPLQHEPASLAGGRLAEVYNGMLGLLAHTLIPNAPWGARLQASP
jgi:hypothetical protein